MPKIIISFCIPTYHRGEFLYNTINHILMCKSNEIEIIVSDNASPDNTEELMKKIDDSRVKYYRRSKNLGYDLNLINCIRKATGEYLFFLSDDDIVELKEIPWLIDIIKNKKNITQILGSVGDNRKDFKKVYIDLPDKYYKAGHDSLVNLYFKKTYLAGTILKKESLDLIQAKKYAGIIYMQHVLGFQAMFVGDTLTTSRILASIPPNPPDSRLTMNKNYCANKLYYHHLSRISQWEDKIRLISEILINYPESRKLILEVCVKVMAANMAKVFIFHPNDFIKIIPVFLKNKHLIFSISFYKTFYKNSRSKFISKYIRRKKMT